MYVLNSAGAIYHEYAGTPGFVQLPGLASDLTPTVEGNYYVLGYPAGGSSSQIYSFDLDSSSSAYANVPGSGKQISTNTKNLYVLSSSGGIYASAISAAQPYAFGGASTTTTFTNGHTPAQTVLGAYQNISATLQFATVTQDSGTLTISDAIGNGDITPSLAADNATTGYTPVVYFSVYNPGPADIQTGTTAPAVSITKSTGFGSATTCNLDVYGDQGSGPVWFTIPGASATISGNTVSVPQTALPPGNNVDFQPGQQVVAISCH